MDNSDIEPEPNKANVQNKDKMASNKLQQNSTSSKHGIQNLTV
jgi:hypothetical protein